MNMRELMPAACLIALLTLYGGGREKPPVRPPAAASGVAEPSYADKRDLEHAYVRSQDRS